jgi:hypothetical protein
LLRTGLALHRAMAVARLALLLFLGAQICDGIFP